MTNRRALSLCLIWCFAGALQADDRKVEPVKAGNDTVDITGSALIGREPVRSVLGVDPGLEMIAVEIRVSPKTDAALGISRDDFTLISRKDGQRSQAMHPSQIAGSGSLVVSSRAPGASGGFGSPRRGPVWGGIPGTGSRPSRVGGDNDIPAGIADGETKATVANSGDGVVNPVLAALKQKELQPIATKEPVTGLLYFIFEGKHKLKDLELMYKTSEGTLMLDFQK